ncbi:hypothetical protein TYRP_011874 [Tyrophagus putrescentiae]|nr:hypothetical protein TYRP_011874 [Tyrophagus putrescentiae]
MDNHRRLLNGPVAGNLGSSSSTNNHNLNNSINNNNSNNNNNNIRGGINGWRRPPLEFANIDLAQEIDEAQGPIRAASFSRCGQLLATGGADAHVRLYCSTKAWRHFAGLRSARTVSEEVMASLAPGSLPFSPDYASLLLFAVFEGHGDEVVDLAWSAHNFLASVSLDRTVRLWHVSQVDCLLVLRHEDYLSTVRFLPSADDRYLVSATLGGVVRLWSLPEKRALFTRNVALERDNRPSLYGRNLITAACFTGNSGSILVLGTADGRLLFYFTDRLQYITQQHVSKGGSSPRVIAIESVSNNTTSSSSKEDNGGGGHRNRQLLVTTDDSTVRLFTTHFWTLSKEVLELKGATLKGAAGGAIRASISPDGAFVVCGSEEAHSFYIWRVAAKNSRNSGSSSSKLGVVPSLWERLNRRGCERIRLNVPETDKESPILPMSPNSSSSSSLVSYDSKTMAESAVEAVEGGGGALLNIDLFADLFDDSLPGEAVTEADEAFEHLEMGALLPPHSSAIVTPTTFAFFAPDPTVFHSLVKYVLVSIDHTGRIRVFTKPHYAA